MFQKKMIIYQAGGLPNYILMPPWPDATFGMPVTDIERLRPTIRAAQKAGYEIELVDKERVAGHLVLHPLNPPEMEAVRKMISE